MAWFQFKILTLSVPIIYIMKQFMNDKKAALN